MSENNDKPGFWAVLPAAVRYDPELPSTAKLLYAEISSMTDRTGYCFASNAYFRRVFGISERTLQDHLRALRSGGFIRIEDGDGGSKQRKIYAGINPLSAPPAENCGGPPQKTAGPPAENCGENNNIHQESDQSPQKPPKGRARENAKLPEWNPDRFEKFWEYYPRLQDGSKPARARAVRAWDKLRPDDSTIDQMATALRRQKQSERWQRGIGIPYASSWINGRMWEDDYQDPETEAEAEEDGDVEWL
jgi:hypothetical protein